MAKRQVGVVQELFRYPVKSMLGERLEQLDVGEMGVIGDRAWALRETNGRVTSAKKWANMLDFRASYDNPPRPEELAPPRIVLPDGRSIHASDADASEIISKALGHEVKLVSRTPKEHSRAEIDPQTIFGEVAIEEVLPNFTGETLPEDFALSHGTFFDSATIHVLATGTLAYMRSLIGDDAQIDPRRFRPNIVVETDPRISGFVEDEWVGGTLEVGDHVQITKIDLALRCVMTTHRQQDLPRDPRILRAAAQHHQAKLGVFAFIGRPGRVRLGDRVWLVN
jgi:MOSC domain-containing protein